MPAPPPPPGAAGSGAAGAATLSWAPLWRHAVWKHSWRGRYARVLSFSEAGVATLDPSAPSLPPTNTWRWAGEFGGVALGETRSEARSARRRCSGGRAV